MITKTDLKEVQELKKSIPHSKIIKYIGCCGLWEYGLFCKITGLKLNWSLIK